MMNNQCCCIIYFILFLFVRSCEGSDYDGDHKGLSNVPDDIPDTATYVNLQYNNISTINNDDFSHLTVCNALHLPYNKISVIANDSFSSMRKLTILTLSSNNIMEINDNTFTGLSSLTLLNLRCNSIRSISSHAFYILTSLRYLQLYHNEISSLPDEVFISLISLIYLNIGNNRLRILSSGLFTRFQSLTELHLYNNELNSISTGIFTKLISLTTLYLSNNNLVTLTYDIFSDDYLEKLKSSDFQLDMRLYGNPFLCDERLSWLKAAEQQGLITFYDLDSKIYYSPSCNNYPDTHWSNVTLPPYTGKFTRTATTTTLSDIDDQDNSSTGNVLNITLYVVATLLIMGANVAVVTAIYCYRKKKRSSHSQLSPCYGMNRSEMIATPAQPDGQINDGYELPVETNTYEYVE